MLYSGYKVVAYCRVSTNKQESFGWQHHTIEKFAKKHNLEVVRVFDEQVSGATSAEDRPIFKNACKFCEEHGYTMIVASVDRLCRSVSFPIKFGSCSFRGDFDLEIICPQENNGYISVEDLAFSILTNFDMVEKLLLPTASKESLKELEFIRKKLSLYNS